MDDPREKLQLFAPQFLSIETDENGNHSGFCEVQRKAHMRKPLKPRWVLRECCYYLIFRILVHGSDNHSPPPSFTFPMHV